MKRKLFALLLAVLCLGTLVLPAFAAEKTGSVTIQLYGDKKVTGGLFYLYKVGRLEDDRFRALDAFDSVVTTFTQQDLDDPDMPGDLLKIIKKKDSGIKESYKGQFKKSNSATVEDVKPGVYLVVQQNAIQGYEKFSPFLITVPKDGKYDVTSNSKVSTPKKDPKPTTAPPETTKPSGKLPQTGQLNWPVPVLAAAGLALFATGALLRRSGRKEDYES